MNHENDENKEPRGSSALAKPFMCVSLIQACGAPAVVAFASSNGGSGLYVVAVILLLSSGFFGVLALLASRWNGAIRAEITRHGAKLKVGV